MLSVTILCLASIDSGTTVNDSPSDYSIEAFRYYLEGVDLLNENAYSEAIDKFKHVIEIDPEFSKAYYKLAIANWWKDDIVSGDKEGSIAQILREKKFSSRKDRLLADGAIALMERRFEDSYILYLELTETYPDEKEAWYGLGEAIYHSGFRSREESVHAFEKAIELDPSFILAYSHIFNVCFAAKDFIRATNYADEIIDANPRSMAGYRFKIWTGIASQDSAMVQDALNDALQLHKTDEELLTLYLSITKAYGEMEDLLTAKRYLEKAIEHDPDTSDYRILMYLGIMFPEDETISSWPRNTRLVPLSKILIMQLSLMP
jgi:tetratricopeptide (TPR) repeat protein